MPLAKVPAGSYVTIDSFDFAPELRLRCQNLGIMAGERIAVLNNRKPCPLVIGAAGARLMLGRELAGRLCVTPIGCA